MANTVNYAQAFTQNQAAPEKDALFLCVKNASVYFLCI